MNTIYDVAILGAGIAGSALAKLLADLGWNVILLDRKRFPRHKVCGEFLSPEAVSMLDALGVRSAVEQLAPSRISRTRLMAPHGNGIEIPLPGVALGISRYALDSTLHSAAQYSGATVRTGTTVICVNPKRKERGYIIETKQGAIRQAYETRAVITAWGANGRIPVAEKRLNRTAQNHYVGIKSHFKGIEMDAVVELYFFDGGYLGLAPVEDGTINAAALFKRSAFPTSPKTILEWIDTARSRNPKLDQKLANAVPVLGTQAAVAPVNLSYKPQAWDEIPQLGDAALMIPPLCGDGMSMALRSAQLCAPLADRYLKGELSLSDWQHAYSQSVLQEFKGPMQWGRVLQTLVDRPFLPRLLLRAAGLMPGIAYRLVQATRLPVQNS
ncbi:NAD(P)/FAD-dependent oxidoreductase [Paenibacillus sp. GCM10027626]|uniref:NAD(P)/FAD-dependent oxidoreductase n=1 Tax=Paenibacillus sp. GCM10027626 TaxID=3273411 RepID=UPI003644EA1C